MAEEIKVLNARQKLLKRMLQNRKAVFGAVVLVIIIISAISAPLLTRFNPNEQDLDNRLLPPSWTNLLGTDNFGRDVFTRILYGGRISLQIGLISVGIGVVFGCLIGLIGGFYGGIIDGILMRFVDILLALPGFLLALSIVAALGPNLQNVMIAVGISNIPRFARIMRASVMQTRELDYVTAALAAGASDFRILFKHVMPNSINPVIVQASLGLATAILAASGLSFLGMGAQPPTPEWGSMIAQARPFIRLAHWIVTFPGLAIVVTVLALNLVGDGLRDIFDPRLKDN